MKIKTERDLSKELLFVPYFFLLLLNWCNDKGEKKIYIVIRKAKEEKEK